MGTKVVIWAGLKPAPSEIAKSHLWNVQKKEWTENRVRRKKRHFGKRKGKRESEPGRGRGVRTFRGPAQPLKIPAVRRAMGGA